MIQLIKRAFGIRSTDTTRGRELARRARRSVRLEVVGLEARELKSGFARSFEGGPANDMAVYRPSNGTWYIATAGSGFNTNPQVQPSWNQPVTQQWGTPGDIPIQNSDFFGNHHADLAVFRPSNGTWYAKDSISGKTISQQWGTQGDIPLASSDFFGNGHADLAVFRPSDGTWYVKDPLTGQQLNVQWGVAGDVPIAHANIDNDGKADIAVYRPSTQSWFVLASSTGYSRTSAYQAQWGAPGDVPIFNTDFNGYGWDDFAVFRPSNGTWYVYDPRIGNTKAFQWGAPGDIPIASSDFFGNGHADLVIYRPSIGTWCIKDPKTGAVVQKQWGVAGDEPLANMDFDADGKADMAIFRPTDNTWHVLTSTSGFSTRIDRQWGTTGDMAVGSPEALQPLVNVPTITTLSNFGGNPIFAADGPTRNDVHQVAAGDCYFLADLAAAVERDPGLIRRSVEDMGNGTYGVNFGLLGGKFQTYLVDANLAVNGAGQLVFAQLGHGNSLWVALMEKAWTFARPALNVVQTGGAGTIAPTAAVGTYAMLDGNGTQAAGQGAPGGYSTEFYAAEGTTSTYVGNAGTSAFLTQVQNDLAAGKSVTVGTKLRAALSAGSALVPSHLYVVAKVNTVVVFGTFTIPVSVTLYNPWGFEVTVTLSDFLANVTGETSAYV